MISFIEEVRQRPAKNKWFWTHWCTTCVDPEGGARVLTQLHCHPIIGPVSPPSVLNQQVTLLLPHLLFICLCFKYRQAGQTRLFHTDANSPQVLYAGCRWDAVSHIWIFRVWSKHVEFRVMTVHNIQPKLSQGYVKKMQIILQRSQRNQRRRQRCMMVDSEVVCTSCSDITDYSWPLNALTVIIWCCHTNWFSCPEATCLQPQCAEQTSRYNTCNWTALQSPSLFYWARKIRTNRPLLSNLSHNVLKENNKSFSQYCNLIHQYEFQRLYFAVYILSYFRSPLHSL